MKFLGSGIISFADSKFASGPVGHDVIPQETIEGLGFIGLRVKGFGFGVKGFGLRLEGLELRVEGLGIRCLCLKACDRTSC